MQVSDITNEQLERYSTAPWEAPYYNVRLMAKAILDYKRKRKVDEARKVILGKLRRVVRMNPNAFDSAEVLVPVEYCGVQITLGELRQWKALEDKQ